MRGLCFYLVRSWLLLNRRRMGHVAAEFLPERLCVVRINLGVIASTRDRNVCHAAVEQSLSAQLGVHVNEDTVGSLSLAGVASHGITVVEMRMLGRVEFNGAATVHPQAQTPVFVDAFDGAQLAVRNSEVVGRRGELDAAAFWIRTSRTRFGLLWKSGS